MKSRRRAAIATVAGLSLAAGGVVSAASADVSTPYVDVVNAAHRGDSAQSPAPARSAGLLDPAPRGPQRAPEPDVDGPDNHDSLEVSVTSDGGTETGVEVHFDRTSRTETGEKPAAPRRFVFLFDSSIRFEPDPFPTCSRETIEEEGVEACPEGSQVGSGRAEIYGQDGETEVAVFNTEYDNGWRGVLIVLPESGIVLENTFERVAGPYRHEYAWASDEIVPPSDTPPGERTATTRFQITFGGVYHDGTQTYSFVRSRASSGDELDFGLWSEFVTGQVIAPTAQTVLR